MKNWILTIIFIGLYFDLLAQNFDFFSRIYVDLAKYNVLDSAYLKCSYKLAYLTDSLAPDKISTDRQVLLIGKNISKYYSQFALDHNQYIREYVKANKPYPRTKDGVWTYEIFKNYPQTKETVTDIGSVLMNNYLYEEQLSVFDWKISNETQKILSYNCQKATTTFRGRDYVAWFTLDIPVNNGPWKFGGLPGLILKIFDTRNHFVYECDGLEQLKKKEPIVFYRLNYTRINRKDLSKLYRRIHEDMAAYNKSLGIKVMEIDEKTKKVKEVEHSSFKIPYNPIELE
jgi:GLPGLI family protein